MKKHPKTDELIDSISDYYIEDRCSTLEEYAGNLEEELARYEALGVRPIVALSDAVLLEVELPVGMDDEFRDDLHKALARMCSRYEDTNPGRVMWVSGYGQKPNFSQADARFLGRSADSDAPETGEPTYNPAVYLVELVEREDLHGRNPLPKAN